MCDLKTLVRLFLGAGICLLFVLAVPRLVSAATFGSGLIKAATVHVHSGYRVDELDWSISGTVAGTDPNILSELIWNDVEIFETQFDYTVGFGPRHRPESVAELRVMSGIGVIYDGGNRDSDYAGDDRTLEFSRSNNATDAGTVYDLSAAAGVRFFWDRANMTLIPLLGYSWHRLELTMTDGVQTVADQGIADDFFAPTIVAVPDLGPFSGLDSRYNVEWYGPYLGLEIRLQPQDNWELRAFYEYHRGDYFAEADWNLRINLAHPVSFRHWADGEGQKVGVDFRYQFHRHWSAGVRSSYQHWEADPGIDVTYFPDGTASRTGFNGANWSSLTYHLSLAYSF